MEAEGDCNACPPSNLPRREAAQLARALSDLHGGLAPLLRATAAEAPEAATQLAPSAAAAASALFVASNQFAAADRDAEQALAAQQLLSGETAAWG